MTGEPDSAQMPGTAPAAYHRPATLAEAVELLAGGELTVLAGGTDHYPGRVGPQRPEAILDIAHIAELHGIRHEADAVVLGAGVTWTEVLEADLPPWFDALKLAAREVGGWQIQNRGTIAGNICNASPAADGTPCLLAMDAEVVLASAGGERRVALPDFLTGYRATARRADELVTAIRLPRPAETARSTFLKLGARYYLVISIAMVAVILETTADGRIAAARIGLGACSATAQRLSDLEAALAGRPLAPGIGEAVTAGHFAHLAPIDDVRGSADYRRRAARTITARALERLARETAGAPADAA